MTHAERQAALEVIAREVRACTRCRLHETRTNAVPGEGHPSTEVMFVGEGPGFNEDRLGRPFVGRAGDKLVELLGSIQWPRDEVFITNVVKCRPPDNRDPLPDEIAACQPFLRRQLEVLDPALVVTLGRFSMATFMPGARISEAHGTVRPADSATGAADASVYALYHPAAALRSTAVAQTSVADMAGVPAALERSRARRASRAAAPAAPGVVPVAIGPSVDAATELPLRPPADPERGSSTEPAEPTEAAEQSGLFQL
jgi:uracil-DNA glycosylase family 4